MTASAQRVSSATSEKVMRPYPAARVEVPATLTERTTALILMPVPMNPTRMAKMTAPMQTPPKVSSMIMMLTGMKPELPPMTTVAMPRTVRVQAMLPKVVMKTQPLRR